MQRRLCSVLLLHLLLVSSYCAFTNSVPYLAVFVHQAAEYQNRRGEEKRKEASRRQSLLSQPAVDITPTNGGAHIWSADKTDLSQFENKWSMKPVKVRGIFDHSREVQIEKEHKGEKGVEIVTPFYTHLDSNGKEQAILVNRGWVP